MSTTLTSPADRADALLTGLSFQELAANIAEYYGIPVGHAVPHPGRICADTIAMISAACALLGERAFPVGLSSQSDRYARR